MADPSFRDLYRDLELEQSASAEDIRQAYRRLALRHHPDKTAANGTSDASMFLVIENAYGTLKDPDRRREYDQKKSIHEQRIHAQRHSLFNFQEPSSTASDPVPAADPDIWKLFGEVEPQTEQIQVQLPVSRAFLIEMGLEAFLEVPGNVSAQQAHERVPPLDEHQKFIYRSWEMTTALAEKREREQRQKRQREETDKGSSVA